VKIVPTRGADSAHALIADSTIRIAVTVLRYDRTLSSGNPELTTSVVFSGGGLAEKFVLVGSGVAAFHVTQQNRNPADSVTGDIAPCVPGRGRSFSLV
jgi:hypothetical protein